MPLLTWPTFSRSRVKTRTPSARGYASPADVIDVTPSQEQDE
jgi:hypothetical protein